MKIVYAGTPDFAVAPLRALAEKGCEIIAVVTREDRPFGRHGVLTPPPVKAFALSAGIPVYQFGKIREHVSELASLGADAMFTCAYGQLLTQAVLDVFPKGVWNAHASLLPKFRGASPVQSAILAGERVTGVTVMKTELALDAGDMLLVKRCPIEEGETSGELSEKLSALAADALCEAYDLISSDDEDLLLQDESAATFCKKIKKEDAKVDFSAPADKVCALINAMSPSPAAFCMHGGKSVNLYRAFAEGDAEGVPGQVIGVTKRGITVRCGSGCARITEAQFAGGKRLSAADILNGRKISVGDMLE